MGNGISIIVPVYNASAYLRDCLDSIRNQTMKEWTCFLVNDGSTDDSQSIIEEYCQMDGRFVGMEKVNEGSPAKTVQYGLKHVDSEFVITIGDDDAISDDFVEKLLKRQKDTNADTVVPRLLCFGGDLNNVLWELPDKKFDNQQVMNGYEGVRLTLLGWKIGFNGSLIRKTLMETTTFGEWSHSDELKTREILVNSKVVAFADTNYYYRSNPASITNAVSPRLFDRTIVEAQLVQFAQKYFPNDENLIKELARLHFSGLQYNIVLYESKKDSLSVNDQKKIVQVLEKSYGMSDIREILKCSPKWGVVIALLRRYKWYHRLVVSHFSK